MMMFSAFQEEALAEEVDAIQCKLDAWESDTSANVLLSARSHVSPQGDDNVNTKKHAAERLQKDLVWQARMGAIDKAVRLI